MARLPRNTNPNHIRLVTIRTLNAQLLLRPDKEMNQIFGGVLAKYQEKFGIIIYAAIALGNHYHLVLKAPRSNLWQFEQNVNRELAKRINRHRNRKGFVWARRYDDQIAPELNDAMDALLYCICNCVSHGLVAHTKDWPGFNTYQQMIGGEDQEYEYVDYGAYNKAKRKARKSGEIVKKFDFTSKHVFKVTRLPNGVFKAVIDKNPRKENRTIAEIIDERIEELIKEREEKEGKTKFLGAKKIRKTNPFSYPKKIKKSPRPICYSKSAEVKARFREWYIPWVEAYRIASLKFRSGDLHIEFPLDCIKPALLYLQ